MSHFESLEPRTLPSGFWSPVTTPTPSPDGTGTMLLLSNGKVMVNGGGGFPSNSWYGLTPDSAGTYEGGTWSNLAPMNVARLYFTSDILPNGKVFVLGGEYASDQDETNSGEIYDPVTDSWTAIANFPEANFGDGPSEVLADGRVLCGSNSDSKTFIYNPSTDKWVAGPDLLNGDTSAEETWIKLPDGSILSYAIQGTTPQTGERFVQGATDAQNKWVPAGAVPVALDSNGGNIFIVPEIGPAVLLPDGRVFQIGASGNTGLYTPPVSPFGTGSWTAGPVIPDGLGTLDTPAAIMPDGHVLFAAGPIDGNNFPGPTEVFEYDPVTNKITTVNSTGPDLSGPPFISRMLMLPSGEVLFSNSTNDLYTYTPGGAPLNSWRPRITNIVDNGNGTFTLTGTQLNGLSEGANYGDDAEMATNFPLVRLTDGNGVVRYGRTFNWSSTGVATGSALETVQFTIPQGASINDQISVVANGIDSLSALTLPGTGGDDTIVFAATPTLDTLTINGSSSTFNPLGLGSIMIDGGGGHDTIIVKSTNSAMTTFIAGSGTQSITIGNNGNLQGILGTLDITNSTSKAITLDIDNSLDPVGRSFNLNTITLKGAATGSVTGLAPGKINFQYPATATVRIETGRGADHANIRATGIPTTVDLDSLPSANPGTDTVSIGNAGQVQEIFGTLNLLDTNSTVSILVDDSADTVGQTVTFGTLNTPGVPAAGTIAGLAPTVIKYAYEQTTVVNVLMGNGTNLETFVAPLSGGTSLNVTGGTQDTATFMAAGNSLFGAVGKQAYSYLANTSGYTAAVFNVGAVVAQALKGGADVADFYPAAKQDVVETLGDSSTAGSTFVFHALGFATVHAFGDATNTAQLYLPANSTFTSDAGSSAMSGPGFVYLATNFGAVKAYGHANNTAYLNSSPNSTFTGTSASSQISSSGFTSTALGFGTVYGSGDSTSRANLFVNTEGTYVGTATYADIYGKGYAVIASGYGSAYGYGGSDSVAFLYPDANGTMVGTSTYADIYGKGYQDFAVGFGNIYAYGGAGNTAYFYPGPNATMIGSPTSSYIYGAGYVDFAGGFGKVYAYGDATDTAYFNVGSNNTFVGLPTYSYINNSTFLSFASGFGTVNATGDSTDTAYLYDSSGNDTFFGRGSTGSMFGTGFRNNVSGFGFVNAYSINGGKDTLDIAGLNYVFQKFGNFQ